MRKTIQKGERCNKCGSVTTSLIYETYCDICGDLIDKDMVCYDVMKNDAEDNARDLDAVTSPDICSIDCFVKYVEGITGFEYLNLALYDESEIRKLARRLKKGAEND